ncbi:hypothetical protein SAMN05421670_0823 [Psychrobacillus psychrotolerans]|uniref:Uncharacterized protein n=1 Tax=Psychrobacillus psychrotolerans TaxID=126156 RepID=A0A1I5VHP8_9BACI|nr:hypothetical protein [Psychrobacillus psychrotolerans]SFQ07009.1 hypothetical protein SAMN05421670_0823 [Psychrobacillus psychrotolerans]
MLIKYELTLNNFYVQTLNEIVKQYNELVPEHASYSYSAQDVIELLLVREHVNNEFRK